LAFVQLESDDLGCAAAPGSATTKTATANGSDRSNEGRSKSRMINRNRALSRGRRPGRAKAGGHVDPGRRPGDRGVAAGRVFRILGHHTFEFVEDRVGDEPGARGEDMSIAEAALLSDEEAKGVNQGERVLGPGHGDVEQPPLLLDLGGISGGEVGGDATVGGVEHEHRVPLLPLGGVDRRQSSSR